MIKAVIFDMYETLIIHFNSPLYVGTQMAIDADIEEEKFLKIWRAEEENRTIGKITLEELAKRENVTKTYLSHFIHDNLNMTFQEYVSSMRFERALKLIRNTSMCLTDISVVSGFSDVKYLSRMLEKHFGKSAQECCQQLRAESGTSAAVEVQTFASEELARQWLTDFWNNYS